MSLEAPQRVEIQSGEQQEELLQQELAKLSDFERTELQSFLEEERGKIMYITAQELGELQMIIENGGNHHRDRHEIIQDFLEDQISEGLSLSDILGEENEQMQVVETLASDILFGEGAVLSSLNLSDRPQRYMTTALSLSIINLINASENPQELINNPESLIAQIAPQLELLRDMSQTRDLLPNGDTHPRIWILREGEGNTIMMNIEEGREFFSGLLAGELDAGTLEQRLEAANTGDPLELPDLSELGRETREVLANIISRLPGNNERLGGIIPPSVDSIPDSLPEEEKKGLMELLMEVFKVLTDMLKSMIDNSTSSSEASQGTSGGTDGVGETPVPNTRLNTIQLTNIDFSRNPDVVTQLARLNIENLEVPSYEDIIQILRGENNTSLTVENRYQVGYGVQVALTELGYTQVGTVDAIIGENTQTALRIFQQSKGIEQTGEINRETLNSLATALEEKENTDNETQ